MVGREVSHVRIVCFTIAYVVLLILSCLSVSQTNRELISSTCGAPLRDIVLADAVLGSLGFVFYIVVFYYMYCSRSTTMITGSILLLVIGATSIGIYIDAERTPSCQEMLSIIRSAINTPNPHEGEILLSVMALVCGIAYVSCGLWLFIVYWYPHTHDPMKLTKAQQNADGR